MAHNLSRDDIRLGLSLIATLTIGTAPILPSPHVYDKVQILLHGHPVPQDVADLGLHLLPVVWFAVELVRKALRSGR